MRMTCTSFQPFYIIETYQLREIQPFILFILMRNHSQTEEPSVTRHATYASVTRHATYALWHVTRPRIRHATNYNASIALFKSLGLFFVASKDLSRLLLPLIWQIRPPHSLIFKKIIIVTNIPTNIHNFRYFIITIYFTLEYFNTTTWLHKHVQYLLHYWNFIIDKYSYQKPHWGTIRHATYALRHVTLCHHICLLVFILFQKNWFTYSFKYFLIQCYQPEILH